MAKRSGTTPRHTPSEPHEHELWLTNDRAQIDLFVTEVLEAMERAGFSESSRFACRLALEEAVSNGFRHGHKTLPPETPERIRWSVDDDRLQVTIQDQGPGFKLETVPDPTLDENLERPSGRGIMLIRAYMTSVRYNAKGNEMTMVYAKPTTRAPGRRR